MSSRQFLVMACLCLAGCSDTRPVNLSDSGPGQPDGSGAPDQGLADASPALDGAGFCSTNAGCAVEEYCHIEGACIASGAKMGECRTRPTECDLLYAPVCACDGTNRSNECHAHAAGLNVAHSGNCSGVVVVTDKKSYAVGEKVVGTVINNTKASVFLQGCSIFTWEKQVGGGWIDKGPTMICGWEGYAKEVTAGSSLSQDELPKGAGIWRLGAFYGVGCLPNQPLSGAQCASTTTAYSDPITVGTPVEICSSLLTEYATALLAARKCSSSTPGQCTKKVPDSLDCGCSTYVQDDALLAAIKKQYYTDLGCTPQPCPPMPCPNIQGAGCVQGKCVDYLPD
jgi:hypothetical protein